MREGNLESPFFFFKNFICHDSVEVLGMQHLLNTPNGCNETKNIMPFQNCRINSPLKDLGSRWDRKVFIVWIFDCDYFYFG